MDEIAGTLSRKKPLNGFHLKMIAVVCMVIDHSVWLFVPVNSVASVGFFLRCLGRITFPIMAFFIAEGYRHTSNVKKYLTRLGIFALISILPFQLFFNGTQWQIPNNVFITLFLGLFSLHLTDRIKDSMGRLIVVMLCSIASSLGDWSVVGVPMIYLFGRIQDPKKRIVYSISIFVLLYLISHFIEYLMGSVFYPAYLTVFGAFLAIPLLLNYNGERGPSNGFTKYLFYWFYPLHLLVFMIIRYLTMGPWF